MKACRFFFSLLSLPCLALLASAVPGQNSGKARLADPEPADAAEVRRQMALIEKLEGVVPDRGAALYFLAASKQHLGETTDALTALKECIALRAKF